MSDKVKKGRVECAYCSQTFVGYDAFRKHLDDGLAECIKCNWDERNKLPQWLRDEDEKRGNWYFLDMRETQFQDLLMNKIMPPNRWSRSKRTNAIDHLSTDMNPYIICPTYTQLDKVRIYAT